MINKKYKVGFIQGVFDMFHIGHLNVLRRAKENCDFLIVGVNSDNLVQEYKHKLPIISFEERSEIVSALKCVDKVVRMDDRDKLAAAEKYNFNALFMGDDWKGTEFYNEMEKKLKKKNIDIVYFPYTHGTSSTILREKLLNIK